MNLLLLQKLNNYLHTFALIGAIGLCSGCASSMNSPFSGWFSGGNRQPEPEVPTQLSTQQSQETGAHFQQANAKPIGSATRTAAVKPPVQDTKLASLQPTGVQLASAKPASYSAAKPGLMMLNQGQDLNAVLQAAPGPVVLDFYTDWCGPCKMLSKVFHKVEPHLVDRNVTVVKVNAEEHRKISKQFNVRQYPTLVLLKQGTVASRQVGALGERDLVNWASQ